MTDMDAGAEPGLRCPACNAEQPAADSCRRCRCDLRLLRDSARRRQHCFAQWSSAMRDGRSAQAITAALEGFDLCPDRDWTRRLATSYLFAGKIATAAALAEQSLAGGTSSACE